MPLTPRVAQWSHTSMLISSSLFAAIMLAEWRLISPGTQAPFCVRAQAASWGAAAESTPAEEKSSLREQEGKPGQFGEDHHVKGCWKLHAMVDAGL